jgi:hypothetical protein
MAESASAIKFTPRLVRGARSIARFLLLPVITLWRKLTGNLRGGYRPELHYMRGPGPKWREQNSR